MSTNEPGPWAVVVNPSKFDDLDAVKARFAALCADHGWPEPSWYTTQISDPGEGQTATPTAPPDCPLVATAPSGVAAMAGHPDGPVARQDQQPGPNSGCRHDAAHGALTGRQGRSTSARSASTTDLLRSFW